MAIDLKKMEKKLDEILENTTKESWEQWLMEREYKNLYKILGDKTFSSMENIKIECNFIFNKVKYTESNNDVGAENYILAA